MSEKEEPPESIEMRLRKAEDMIAHLNRVVYDISTRQVMIWASSTTSMDEALDQTWRWLTPQLPEGFAIAEVKWTRSVRDLRILRVDMVYEWPDGLTEVRRKILEAFVVLPRPYNEEVIVIPHRVEDWLASHPDFLTPLKDRRRSRKLTLEEVKALKAGGKTDESPAQIIRTARSAQKKEK